MARRNEHSREELREMALAAAEAILEEQGLDGLSTRKVAARMGYTVGTLYLVFRNLDGLILEVNGRTLAALQQTLESSLAATTDRPLAQRLKALARAYHDFALCHPARWALLYEHRSPDAAVPPWLSEAVHGLFALLEDLLQPLTGADPATALAARTLWGSVHGICVLAVTDKLDVAGPLEVDAAFASLIDNYLTGLTAQDRGD
ncbi:MAG TPA: TetR/AcrR family transcriptional regulator [Gammaproteobacteria bacterium]|nr:TetR/AcrR family transcriptional regulator [Gammaproteobacteria bacterium]